MQFRRSIVGPVVVLGALGGAVAIAVPDAIAGSNQASGAQQTHPRVKPSVGHRRTTFELTFTLAQAPGRAGLVQSDYRPVVSAPDHASASCRPAEPGQITSGSQGSTSKIALHPPAHGWCTGRYEVTVYLQRRSVCGPPVEGASVTACPVSVAANTPSSPEDLDTGETHFTVR